MSDLPPTVLPGTPVFAASEVFLPGSLCWVGTAEAAAAGLVDVIVFGTTGEDDTTIPET